MQICLNGDWVRHDGGDANRVPDGGWQTVRVPEYPRNAASGSAWFRLDFRIPEELGGGGRRLVLRFVRVRHYAKLLLNGVMCGENWGQRAPFEVDVTTAGRPGQLNRLEVWVHSCSAEYAMPGKVVDDPRTRHRLSTLIGYRDQATIAEDVFLVSRPDLYVSRAVTTPSVRKKTLTVRLTIANQSVHAREVVIANRVFLSSAEVLKMPDKKLEVAAGESRTVTVSAPWAEARWWGYPPYGEPVLYHLETRVLGRRGRPVDRLITRFGFREVWTEGDRIVLNGKDLRLLGYWQPEASGRSVWTLRMAAVRSAGCNAIHNHAEQREPAFYDTADELGLLVWDANFCGGPLGTTQEIDVAHSFPDVLAELERQYPLWAEAVANHPSVVTLMIGCLLDEPDEVRLAEAYHAVDSTRLTHLSDGPAIPPMQLASCSARFEMADEDPLASIKSSYAELGGQLRTWHGQTAPLVYKEIYYELSPVHPGKARRSPTPGDTALATRRAIDFLGEKRVAGVIFYSQQAFEEQAPRDAPIAWPSESGEGQHAGSVLTGGQPWGQHDFVNVHDSGHPAVRPTVVAAAMREAGRRYLGHGVPAASFRRPEVIVTVTSNGNPVADAYVFAVPADGAVAPTLGMRTDRDGRAWFSLRDPGRYSFLCRAEEGWRSVELDAPLQPLDLASGGMGSILYVELPL